MKKEFSISQQFYRIPVETIKVEKKNHQITSESFLSRVMVEEDLCGWAGRGVGERGVVK